MTWWLRQLRWWLFMLMGVVVCAGLGFVGYGPVGALVTGIGWLVTGVVASYLIVNE